MDKVVRKTFADSVSSLFRKLPESTVNAEVEWLLFKAAVASSAALVCGRKRLVVASNGTKVTLWCNQEVKINVVYKVWFQSNAGSLLYSRYAEDQKSAALMVRKPIMQSSYKNE